MVYTTDMSEAQPEPKFLKHLNGRFSRRTSAPVFTRWRVFHIRPTRYGPLCQRRRSIRWLLHASGREFLISDTHNAEKALIEAPLIDSDGNISVAAKILGIDRNTLYAKIDKYKIPC